MKNILTAIAIMSTIAIASNKTIAQCNPWCTGGNAINSGDFLGGLSGGGNPLRLKTEDAQDIRFYTNAGSGTFNGLAMTILGSGNQGFVGIGTSSPSSLLHLDGSAAPTTTGEVFRTNGKSGSATYWRMFRNGTEYGTIYNNNDNHFYFEAPYSNSGNYGNMYFQTGGANTAMTILGSNQFVGIGTTDPKNLLHLYGGGIQLTNSNTGSSTSTDGFQFYLSTADGVIDNKEQSKDILFNTTTSGGNSTKMIIKATGEVGINVATPARKLEVKDGGVSSGPQLRLTYTQGSFYTDFLTNSSGNLIITPNGGNTGIGSGTPTATLHVFGNEKVDNMSTSSGHNVVVWDASTHELLYNASLAGTGNVSTCSSTTQNTVPRFCSTPTDIQNSQITDDGAYVGINSASSNGHLNIYNPNSGTAYTSGLWVKNEYSGTRGITVEGQAYGMYLTTTGGAAGTGEGIHISTSGSNTNNYGIDVGVSGGSTNNYGVSALSGDFQTNNYGLQGQAGNASTNNLGVYGITTGGGTLNAGVYGSSNGNTGANDWAGFFSGNAKVTGNFFVVGTPFNIGGTGSWNTSDATLKQDIESLSADDATQWINELQPSSYYFDTLQYPQFHFPHEKQFGFIAQDVESVLPNMVRDVQIDSNLTVKMLNYQEFIAILTAVVKQQSGSITDLQNQLTSVQSQLTSLQDQVNACCGMGMRSSGNDNSNSQSIDLATNNQSQLGNASPNPNGGQTTIPFHLPQTVVKAEMVFTDLLGQEVNRVELGARGFNKIDVTTTNLEDGTYNYTLYADGKAIDTKQFVKAH